MRNPSFLFVRHALIAQRRMPVLAFLGAVVLFACTDGRSLTEADTSAQVSLALRPVFHSIGSTNRAAPVNRARLTVLNAATNDTIAGPFTRDVNPNDAVFSLPVTFDLPQGVATMSVVVAVQLINVTGTTETIEWSGNSEPISVAPGVDNPAPSVINVVQGPPENLQVTGIRITPVAGLVEGDTVQLNAVVDGATAPRIFWSSLDETRATVSANGLVRTIVPGSARVIARAGLHADTLVVDVKQRPASVIVNASTLSFTFIGQQLALNGTVADPRGDPIIGDSLIFVIAEPGLLAQPVRGSFSALAPGNTSITALAASAPGIRLSIAVTIAPVVALLTLSTDAVAFSSVGASQHVTGVATDAGGTVIGSAVLQWHSENPAIAEVTSDGTISARSAGNTAVVATVQSVSARVQVSVDLIAANITVTPSTVLLESLGATTTLSAVARDAGGTPLSGAAITWTSSAQGVADVDANGVVTARSNGTATITATGPGGVNGSAFVTVSQRIARLSAAPSALTFASLGEVAAIRVDAFDANGNAVALASSALVWSSSAPAVAAVDQTGTVTAGAAGTATVTVVSSSGATAEIAVTVAQQAATLSLTPLADTLTAVGATSQFTATTRDARGNVITDAQFSWTSSDPAVVSVTQTGLATAHTSGTATVEVTSGDLHAAAAVAVQLPVARVDVTPAQVDLFSHQETAQFAAVARDAAGNVIEGVDFSWSSTAPTVIDVDPATGLATALDNGTATIVAVAPNSVSGRAVAVVNRRVAQVVVSPGTLTMERGSSHQFTAAAQDANGFEIAVDTTEWSSTSTAVATVSSTGLVTAMSDTGHATIMARIRGFGGTADVTAIASTVIPSDGVEIVPQYSVLEVSNCIPFGNNTDYRFTGFLYRNVPAFHMNVGDRIAFDLGAINGQDIRRNIYFSALSTNPDPAQANGSTNISQGINALGWTQVVSDANVPQNPRGNTVIGDYELIFTAEAPYDFPGGGFAIGFSASPPASIADHSCEQVLVSTNSSDPSGHFYARFLHQDHLTTGVIDNSGFSDAQYIGGFKIYPPSFNVFTIQPGVRLIGPPLPRRTTKPVPGDGSIGDTAVTSPTRKRDQPASPPTARKVNRKAALKDPGNAVGNGRILSSASHR